MTKKFFTDESLETLIDETKSYVDSAVSTKANSSHTHSISNVTNLQSSLDSKVPTSRTINGKELTSNITLSANDVGASASGHTHTDYVNQNAFSNVKVGNTTVAADTTTDTLEIAAGTGISVAGDATNDKVTITNSGVRSIATGTSNGTVSVNTNGSSADVKVKGLGSAAYTASTAYDAAGTAQSKADSALASAKTYTDGKISALLDGATDTTLDSIKELADAIKSNDSAIDALNTVAGTKANASDLTSHTGNKSNPHGVTLEQLGVTATVAEVNKMDGVTATTAELNILDGVTATTAEINYLDGVTSAIQGQLDGKSATGHTHNYAGSSSVGGAATSANKLNTNAGTSTQPVYFDAGIPKACTYTLGKSVPSDAIFTDTVYTHPTTSGNKHIPSGGSSGQILRWAADGTAAWGADNNTTYTLESFGVYASGDELSMLEGIEGNVQQLLNEKAPGDHSHSKSEIVSALGYTPPTQDTVYTHPAYTARTGKPTANQTPGFGGTATVSQITSDASGHVTGATDRTITIPSTLSNGTGTAGLIKTSSTVTSSSGYTACPVINGVPYYKDTDTTYSLSSFGITATAAELNYTDGVTSNIQTQLDSLQGNMADSINTISGLQSSFSEHLTDYSSHTHEAADITSGTLGVARGGTGRATLTSGYFLRGNGTSAVTQTKPASVRSAIGVTEGTWTPSFHGGGSPTVVATGRYLKSGNLVIVHFYVNVTGTLSGSASSYIYLDGLPYAPDFSDGSVWYSGGGCFQGGTPVQASGTFSGYQISNTGYIYPRVTYVSGGINAQDYYNRKPASGANIHMAGTIMYYTAS